MTTKIKLANNVADVDTTTAAPTDGQALVWDNANSVWKPGTVASGGGTSAVSSAQFYTQTTDLVTASSMVANIPQPIYDTEFVLEAGKSYKFDFSFILQRNGGSESVITYMGFGGTANVASILYQGSGIADGSSGITNDSTAGESFRTATTSLSEIVVSRATTNQVTSFEGSGVVTIAAGGGGTFIPQFAVSQNTTTYTTLTGSYFLIDSYEGSGASLSIDNLTDVDTTTTAPTDGQALLWDNANSLWKPGTVASGGSGLEYQSVQTADFTASAGKLYPVDTTSGAVTVTLPASPSTGDRIGIIDYAGTAGINSISIDPDGLKIAGIPALASIANNRAAITILYTGSDMGWVAESAINVTSIAPSLVVEYLVVAGGGPGGSYYGSAGGGAGGVIIGESDTYALNAGTNYTVTVGAGGTGSAYVGDASTYRGTNGSNSVFDSYIAVGGGAAGTYTAIAAERNGRTGGSGGGAAGTDVGLGAPGNGTADQGYAGGASATNGGGSGGGGAGGLGGSTAGSNAGAGGIGIQSSITGSPTYYAGGGGGAFANGGTGGTGGLGGGGDGGSGHTVVTTAGTPGTTNTGGGGGGRGTTAAGHNGGSGIVIIATPDHKPLSSIGAGLTYTLDTSSRGGYYVYSFTAGTGSIGW